MRTNNKTARLAGRLTITELEQIRQRAEAASPGPWSYTEDEYSWDLYDGNLPMELKIIKAPKESEEYAEYWPERADADFIANARQDIPRLLTEVETLITEKAAARRMLDELIGEMANAAEAGYALAPETVREDIEKIRKELIDHGE
jgi:hypothetical protein